MPRFITNDAQDTLEIVQQLITKTLCHGEEEELEKLRVIETFLLRLIEAFTA